MPQPLLIDNEAETNRPAAARILADAAVYASAAVVAYLVLLSVRLPGLKVGSPLANALAHAAIVVLPALAGILIAARPVVYKLEPGEAILARRSYFTHLRRDWWKLLPLWPALVLGILILARHAAKLFVSPGEVGPTSFSTVLFTVAIFFLVPLFYYGVFFRQHELRAGDEGLRLGLPHFVEWRSLDRVARHADVMYFFHKDVPAAPVTSFTRTRDPQMTAALDELLGRHNITIVEERPRAGSIKTLAIVLTLLILALGAVLYYRGVVNGRWVVLMTFVLGVVGEKMIERLRGVHRLTRVQPMVVRRPVVPPMPIAAGSPEADDEGPTNTELTDALEALAARGDQVDPETRRAFERQLLAAKLVVPAYLKRADAPAARGEQKLPDLEFMMAQGTNGHALLPVFSDLTSMAAWIPRECNYTTLAGADVAAWVLAGDVPAIVLNPANPVSREIPRAELQRILTGPAPDESRPQVIVPPPSGVTVRPRARKN